MLIDVPHPVLGRTRQQGIVPRLSETPGGVRWAGPEVGDHTEAILGELGYGSADIGTLVAQGVVCTPAGRAVPA